MKSLIALSLLSTVAACDMGTETDVGQVSAESKNKNKDVKIFAPNQDIKGKSYGKHSARFWEFALEYPLDDGHPFLGTAPSFENRQDGNVWYWSAPDGPAEFDECMPNNKILYLTIRDVECSTLEADPFHGTTAAEQASCADYWADHIRNVFVNLNGEDLSGLENHRFQSGQFKVKAPTPFIFGDVGGKGTSSGDGYYLAMDLPKGDHTIHYGGEFYFAPGELGDDEVILPKDITLNISVY